MCGADAAHVLGLLMRHVREDHAVHACRLEIRDKFLKAIVVHHVDVAHADERDLGVFADLLDDRECLLHRHAVLQRNDTCLLNNGTVRHRIGEWKSEFDHVCARLLSTAYNIHGRFCARASCRHVDIKPRTPFGAKLREFFIQPLAHAISSPSSFATICTSLSPRPERQTTIFSPAFVSGMSFSR